MAKKTSVPPVDYKALYEEQLKKNQELSANRSRHAPLKTHSEFFRNKNTQDPKVWDNMSETIKFLETQYPDFVAELKTENNGLMDITQFHELLVKKLGLK